MIDNWYILISGYTQNLSKTTGMERLWRSLRPRSGPDTAVLLYPWDQDWKAVAAFLRRNSGTPKVKVAAYSWGAGHGFVHLARALGSEGIGIDRAVLCDPVYRTAWLPTWFNIAPRSLWGDRKIRIPANVGHVDWLFQRVNKPAGHEPVGESATTVVTPGVQIQYPHQGADDHPEFHKMALKL